MAEHNSFGRTRQCAACPWKKNTVPHRDIPNYRPEMHAALTSTSSEGVSSLDGFLMMACHETYAPEQQACVGWLSNQLGPGNNMGLRLAVMGKLKEPLLLAGSQHESVERMCASAAEQQRKAVRHG